MNYLGLLDLFEQHGLEIFNPMLNELKFILLGILAKFFMMEKVEAFNY